MNYVDDKTKPKTICCIRQVLEIEPQNKAAINQVTICKKVVKDSHDKEKKLYANMFTKFANVDNEVKP